MLKHPPSKTKYVIGIDTGGTFTDCCVLTDKGELFFNKAPTTPHELSQGVMDAVDAASQTMGITAGELIRNCTMFKHGTTVGTNALIDRKGSRVGFITTKGFEDTTIIGRSIQRVDGLGEEEIKHLAYTTKPEPIVPRQRIRGVYERMDYAGNVLVPINVEDAREQIRYLVEKEKVEALAVSLLFSWVNPAHERKIKELIHEMYPGSNLYLTFSHELVPVVREYGRANTVIIDAFLGKRMENYIGGLHDRLNEQGFRGNLMIMQANGGVVQRQEMAPVRTLSSGPAGGVIATELIGKLLGHENIISTDMGGTSFDVGLIIDGHWRYLKEPIVSRWRMIMPIIDVESIGAGGGTIARVNPQTKRLIVGPQSAGASPGPVCYDTGGEEPTVSDADLLLGILNPDYYLGGRKKINKAKAERIMKARIADPLGMSVTEAAAGVCQIVNSHMSDLIRKQVIRTGHLPEEFVLYAFGGGGPVHAAFYTGDLGIKQAYCFPTSPVFSAFGVAAADVVHTALSSYRYFLPCDPAELNARIASLEDGLMEAMTREGFKRSQVTFRCTFYMRYRRQMKELAIVLPAIKYDEKSIKDIMDLWEKKFEETYGQGASYRQAGIELVSMEIDAVGKNSLARLPKYTPAGKDPKPAFKNRRPVLFPGVTRDFVSASIYEHGLLRPGNVVEGPAIVEAPSSTIVLPPGKTARVDSYLNVCIEL